MRRALLPLVAAVAAGCGSSAATAQSPRAVADPGSACDGAARMVVATPADGRTYLGAFAFFGNTEDSATRARVRAFERVSGHRPAWAYVSDNWGRGIRFPASNVRAIRAAGSVPYVRMMPRSDFAEPHGPDRRWSLRSIVDGRHDAALRRWFRDAATVPGPVMVEFAAEVNGDWFSWNGRWNGGGRRDGYGSRRWPDGPELYRDAHRRLVRLSREEGARNLTWVFHVDAESSPDTWWNAARWYWPGARYVDWIALSAYGSQSPGEPVRPLVEVLDPGYRAATRLSPATPILLAEFAVAAAPGRDTAAWTRSAIEALSSGRYPRLRGAAWWHERWVEADGSVVDLRVGSTPAQARAYRAATSSDRFATTVTAACRP